MAGKMTRKTLNDFLLACKDDVCIIPAPLFGEFIQGMKIRDEKFLESTSKLCQTQDRLCFAIEHIASNMHSEETNVHRPPADDPNMLHETLVKIGEKLDMLTEAVREGAISINNKMAGEKVLKTAEESISKIKELRGQVLKTDKLSSYYEELYTQDPPFVLEKFRVQVNDGVPEYELDIRREEALSNARRQVRLMQVRMNDFNQKIENLQEQVSSVLSSPMISPTEKIILEDQMQKDEEQNAKECDEVFNHVKAACSKELQSDQTQFLLKFPSTNPRYRSRTNQNRPSDILEDYDENGNRLVSHLDPKYKKRQKRHRRRKTHWNWRD